MYCIYHYSVKLSNPQGCLKLLNLRKIDFILTPPEEPQWLE